MRAPIVWPVDLPELAAVQDRLATLTPVPWSPPNGAFAVGASYCCAARGGPPRAHDVAASAAEAAGRRVGREPGWAAASLRPPDGEVRTVVAAGLLHGEYRPGALALREGPLREVAFRRLDQLPDVLLVDAAGRDHPRRAGLALHLGAIVGVPTVGATDRALRAHGDEPADQRGATSPLLLDGEVVGYWLRVQPGVRPLAVHAGWRTSPDIAVEVVLREARSHRTPDVMAAARRAARQVRTSAQHAR